MFIETQEEGIFINLDNVETIYAEMGLEERNAPCRIFAEFATKRVMIGKYKNWERACNALREIMKRYEASGKRVYNMPEE